MSVYERHANGLPADLTGRRSDGKIAAVVVIVILTAVLLALGIVLLTGVIRIGSPGLSRVATAARIKSDRSPVEKETRFTGEEPRIYCCAHARAFEDTSLEIRWYVGSELVRKYKQKFSTITGTSSGKFITSSANIAFYLDRPGGGWTSGTYTVRLFVNGKEAAKAGFSVGQGGATDTKPGMALYEDPSKLFSIRYPENWIRAHPSSLNGALAGYIAPGASSYPPRFVVVPTDFESASPDYLNGVLGAKTPAGELFSKYSLGEKQGARRVFEWEDKSGTSVFKLKSIQVLVRGRDRVYGLNCHSLATEYKSNLSVFNSIINSFRVSD